MGLLPLRSRQSLVVVLDSPLMTLSNSTLIRLIALASVAMGTQGQTTIATVSLSTTPYELAINPKTNMIYVATSVATGGMVVIDGTTNAITPLKTGPAAAIAVNTLTNKVYVASNNLTVIDGATNAISMYGTSSGSMCIAVNEITNRIYVGNYYDASVSVVEGASNVFRMVNVAPRPIGLAVDTVRNRVYVLSETLDNVGTVTVIDGATNSVLASLPVGHNPAKMVLSPAENKVYVANALSGEITVIEGVSYSLTTINVADSYALDVAVNPTTNKVYVAGYSLHGFGELTIIQGATDSAVTLNMGDFAPTALAVNAVTNKLYIRDPLSVGILDGATNSFATLDVGGTAGLGVNPTTNRIYIADELGNRITVIDGGPRKDIVNGASFESGLAAPNTILSLFGPDLACLGNLEVRSGNYPIPILAATATQINFVFFSYDNFRSASIKVACNGTVTKTIVMPRAAVAPGIFTIGQAGFGQGSILNQDSSVNGPSNPAPRSTYVSAYGTGFGPLNGAADGLRHLDVSVTAAIGGVPALVTYAGEAPGYTSGLQQINIQIPADAPTGPSVPIVVMASGIPTQPGVTIAVR
jgi:uncharacterized protein (TIGR03437 family)